MSKNGADSNQLLARFKGLLDGKMMNRESPVFPQVVKFLKNFPSKLEEAEKKRFIALIQSAFQVTQDELVQALTEVPEEENDVETKVEKSPQDLEDELWRLVPSGFYHRYCDFTRLTESPLAYHLFAAIVLVGAICNRRLYFDMAHFRYYPATGIIILGPSGIKKTSAANIAMGLLLDTQLVRMYSDKLTPEALIEAMRPSATGIVYAPELSVLMGKQKYNEGLVPLLTRFMDCPDFWESGTISRGKAPLKDIAISFIGCSTPDWFINNTPPDTFGGGFVARILLIMQFDCARVVRIPKVPNESAKKALLGELMDMHKMNGEMTLSTAADRYHEEWYYAFKKVQKHPEHELLLTYYQRKPDHLLRLAMALHIADCRNMLICLSCVERAVALLEWIEQFLPPMFRNMFRTAIGEKQQYILRLIRGFGGVVEHTTLLRRVQHRMDAGEVRSIVASLKEADLIEEVTNQFFHTYRAK